MTVDYERNGRPSIAGDREARRRDIVKPGLRGRRAGPWYPVCHQAVAPPAYPASPPRTLCSPTGNRFTRDFTHPAPRRCLHPLFHPPAPARRDVPSAPAPSRPRPALDLSHPLFHPTPPPARRDVPFSRARVGRDRLLISLTHPPRVGRDRLFSRSDVRGDCPYRSNAHTTENSSRCWPPVSLVRPGWLRPSLKKPPSSPVEWSYRCSSRKMANWAPTCRL